MRRFAALAIATTSAVTGCGSGPVDRPSASPRSFCSLVEDLRDQSQVASSLDVDSSMSHEEIEQRTARFERHLHESTERGERLLAELEAVAPAELATDFRLLRDDAARRANAFRNAQSDPAALFEGVWSSNTTDVVAARARVDAYARTECGTAFGPPPASP